MLLSKSNISSLVSELGLMLVFFHSNCICLSISNLLTIHLRSPKQLLILRLIYDGMEVLILKGACILVLALFGKQGKTMITNRRFFASVGDVEVNVTLLDL